MMGLTILQLVMLVAVVICGGNGVNQKPSSKGSSVIHHVSHDNISSSTGNPHGSNHSDSFYRKFIRLDSSNETQSHPDSHHGNSNHSHPDSSHKNESNFSSSNGNHSSPLSSHGNRSLSYSLFRNQSLSSTSYRNQSSHGNHSLPDSSHNNHSHSTSPHGNHDHSTSPHGNHSHPVRLGGNNKTKSSDGNHSHIVNTSSHVNQSHSTSAHGNESSHKNSSHSTSSHKNQSLSSSPHVNHSQPATLTGNDHAGSADGNHKHPVNTDVQVNQNHSTSIYGNHSFSSSSHINQSYAADIYGNHSHSTSSHRNLSHSISPYGNHSHSTSPHGNQNHSIALNETNHTTSTHGNTIHATVNANSISVNVNHSHSVKTHPPSTNLTSFSTHNNTHHKEHPNVKPAMSPNSLPVSSKSPENSTTPTSPTSTQLEVNLSPPHQHQVLPQGDSKTLKTDSTKNITSDTKIPRHYPCVATAPRLNMKLDMLMGEWYPAKISRTTENLWLHSFEKDHGIMDQNLNPCFVMDFRMPSLRDKFLSISLHSNNQSTKIDAILLGDEKHPKGSKWAVSWPNGEDTLTSIVATGVIGPSKSRYTWLLTVDCDLNGNVESDWAVMARVPERISDSSMSTILSIVEGIKGLRIDDTITYRPEDCFT